MVFNQGCPYTYCTITQEVKIFRFQLAKCYATVFLLQNFISAATLVPKNTKIVLEEKALCGLIESHQSSK
jgi:hypothetical protein